MHLDILVNAGMSTDISPIMPWNMIVENSVVRASCGVMDQMAYACGEANKLLAMVCQFLMFLLNEGLRAREKLKAPHVLDWMLTEAKIQHQQRHMLKATTHVKSNKNVLRGAFLKAMLKADKTAHAQSRPFNAACHGAIVATIMKILIVVSDAWSVFQMEYQENHNLSRKEFGIEEHRLELQAYHCTIKALRA
ncbi:L-arabinokinase-like protein isoform X2 [Tanacetum coccineum]